jgi:hypothetical protein
MHQVRHFEDEPGRRSAAKLLSKGLPWGSCTAQNAAGFRRVGTKFHDAGLFPAIHFDYFVLRGANLSLIA